MPQRRLGLEEAIEVLRAVHGDPPPPPTRDPWEAILRINAAYLVEDERREETFRSLARRIGTTPRRILGARPGELEGAIERGGMKPEMRAEKLRECARIALEVDVAKLAQHLLQDGSKERIAALRKALKRFPGIGDPGADELLLLLGRARTLAPESNALRVLTRLGLATETKSYAATYRAAQRALEPEIPDDPEWLCTARALLRAHGRATCTRTNPKCAACPLRRRCPSADRCG